MSPSRLPFVLCCLLIASALPGCGSEEPGDCGIYVGNPAECSELAFQVAGIDGVVYDSGQFAVVSTIRVGCDDSSELIETDPPEPTVDLLGASTLLLPAGDYCGLAFGVEGGEMSLSGHTVEGEATFDIALQMERVVVRRAEPIELEGQDLVLELAEPGWVDLDTLNLEPGSHTSIRSSSPAATAIVTQFEEHSALFTELTVDRTIDESERSSGPIAEGERRGETD